IGGGGIGEQLLKALKLSTLEMNVFGTDTTKRCKNIFEVDKFFIVKPAYSVEYCENILNICSDNKIDVIFPGSEPELKVLSKNREIFETQNIFLPINPDNVIETCLNKIKTVEFLKKNGFNYPKSIHIKSKTDLELVDFLPAVIKPSIGGSGSANIMIAQSKKEVMAFGSYLLKIYSEFIIQEYIGTPEHEYTVGILLSMKGEYINSIALKRIIESGLGCKIKVKNRTNNDKLGESLVISTGISQGEISKYPEVTDVCREIALKLGAKSSINIQCRFFQNKVYVFEINPRFSGTTSLRAIAGYNEPEILLENHFYKKPFIIDAKFNKCTILRGLNETKI
ncbi:ATP-grasp domain-containing protein, partial [Bacteroidota bacterium]